jgi:hypothetical protein
VATRNEGGSELRERPLGEVAKDLTSDLSLLVRQEIELAKAEMAEKGRTAAPGLGMFGGAGVVALCAAGALTAFLVLVLALFLPEWLRRSPSGSCSAAVAYVLSSRARSGSPKLASRFPEQTIETVKEDVQWAKTRASSARK